MWDGHPVLTAEVPTLSAGTVFFVYLLRGGLPYVPDFRLSGNVIISALSDTSIYNEYSSNHRDYTLQSNGYYTKLSSPCRCNVRNASHL